jgi:hypothetical protein
MNKLRRVILVTKRQLPGGAEAVQEEGQHCCRGRGSVRRPAQGGVATKADGRCVGMGQPDTNMPDI